MQLHDRELEIHLIIFENLEGIKLVKVLEDVLNVFRYLLANDVCSLYIYLSPFKDFPEVHYVR